MNDRLESTSDRLDLAADTSSIHTAQEAILQYARDLRALNVSTEQDFLSLGLSLGRVSSEAQDISALAASVVELVRNEEVERDVSLFRDLFDSLDVHFRQFLLKMERGHGPLSRMRDMVNDAYGPLSAFRKIVKHLCVLSVTTRIENARLLNIDNSFAILADNVEKLSVMIAVKSRSFLEGLTSLQETIEETARQLVTSRAFMEERTDLMLRSLSKNLSMLSEKRSSSLRAGSVLAGRSDEVSEGVSEVVSSLQFHDITRQQLEHVADVFEEICARQSDNADTSAAMDVLGQVAGLQIDQLEHAKDELISAIERVINGLHQIASLLADMSRDATSLINGTGNGGSSFLSELNGSLSIVMDSFAANEETGRNLSAAVRSVTGMVEKLTVFVNDIEEIGFDIELIALNAQIKASHTAEDGGALGVLAEAIRNLSDDAGSQVLIMTAALKGVSGAALELDALGLEERSAGRSEHPIEKQMQDLLEALDRSHQTLFRRLGDLDKRSLGLSCSIETAVRGITAHGRADEVLGDIAKGLKTLIPSGPRATDHAKRNDFLELVANRYTMVQERDIHESYLTVAHGAGQTKDGLSGTPWVLRQDKNSDFGKNVELF